MVRLEQVKDSRRKSGKSASVLSRLRTSRQKRGISLEDIAERSKISLFFLKAIEAGEFEKLPGGIYDTCYLRQYAAHIGFPEAELFALYHSHAHPATQDHPVRSVSARNRLVDLVSSWLGHN